MASSFKLFCFGFGYSCAALARLCADAGWKISGTCRTPQKRDYLIQQGIDAHCMSDDEMLENTADIFRDVTHIVHSIPPSSSGDNVSRHYTKALSAAPMLQWFAYLSTTGVYGDHQGKWVDETTPPTPPDERTKRRLEAEATWLASGLPVHVFRLAGIYGPGRNAFEDVLKLHAHRIYKEGQVFSRIHVEDIARVLFASIAQPCIGQIYNVCDDEPASAPEVVEYASMLAGVEPPPMQDYATAQLSDMARSFYASNRRVSNRKIKESLGVKLLFPTYRQGLDAIAKANS